MISVDIHTELSAEAAKKLRAQNIKNVTLKVADAISGMPAQTPYDLIVYTGSSPMEPAGVREQLNIGGAMFIVLGQAPVMQATLIHRVSETGFNEKVLFETCIPELINAPQAQQFEF